MNRPQAISRGNPMACSLLTAPSGSSSGAGSVRLSAFCPSLTIPFAPVSQHYYRRTEILQATPRTSSLPSRLGILSVRRKRRRRAGDLRCGLTRLSSDSAHKLLPSLATRDQWLNYWGDSDVQRAGKLVEVSAIAFLGLWGCYFTSFFLGGGTTSIIGASFLFYWLLAPNITAWRQNRALRGRIAPSPGDDGNSMAIFSARVVSATEEYHPMTGLPVFLRMVVEDEDGRALKFRTRTKVEYARIRPGMVVEAVL